MDFGFTLKPDHDIERFVALTRQAEAAGFTYGWLFDNHVPFREVYPLLTLMALNTTHMRLGTCVTNPATRDPSVTASALATLDEISGGRMDLGIGRGDSSVRALGQPPTSSDVLVPFVAPSRASVIALLPCPCRIDRSDDADERCVGATITQAQRLLQAAEGLGVHEDDASSGGDAALRARTAALEAMARLYAVA